LFGLFNCSRNGCENHEIILEDYAQIEDSLKILNLGFLMIFGCATFGTRPHGTDKERMKESKQFNAELGTFANRRPHLFAQMKKNTMNWATFKKYFTGGDPNKVPLSKLPEMKPDIEKFLTPSPDLKVIWFGHSTFLLNLDGIIIMVDPVFSGSAAPVSFLAKRFQEPVLSLAELPKIDYVLLSHDHYDHLDMESIKFFKNQKVEFIAPLGVGSHLKGWGIEKERITELDWWEKTTKPNEVDFIATPAQHFSGRDGFNENETLWASWVIQKGKHKVYFSGDSGYDIHFKEIGDRFGPFDIAFLETGQYDEQWKEVHMMPDEAAQAYFDLKAKIFFPVHWGMFVLANHSWYDPILRISGESLKRNINLIAPKIGELVQVVDGVKTADWWSSEIKE
jgi:L-ascorbate metabolism protein UlaG (beta-lactamase superfamily)